MKALVTGGAGFIGSHIVDALLAGGHDVVTLDDLSTGTRGNLAHLASEKRHRFIEGDIRDLWTCLEACRGADVVFHQAAIGSVPRSMQDPAETLSVNVGGTATVLQAARDTGVRRVVYASSSSVYGDSDRLPMREGEEGLALSPYAESKRMTENLAAIFHRCFHLSCIGLRYFNVYGPRQRPDGPYAAVIPCFFDQVSRGEPPVIYGDGSQTRDFTHVDDVVAANLRAARASEDVCGTAYNVAGGCAVSVAELARRIVATTGRALEPVHHPPRAGEARHSIADVSRAQERLGHHAVRDLDRGLAELASHRRCAGAAAS